MTYGNLQAPNVSVESLPPSSQRDLRSDHAGEAGAVMIYRGILKLTKDPEIAEFAKNHLETEEKHLLLFESWMPKTHQSKLIFLWKVSGFLTGAIAGLGSKYFTYLTIQTIETFVIAHYQRQITSGPPELSQMLRALQLDETKHRKEAEALLNKAPNLMERFWRYAVEQGSRGAVSMARLI